MLHDDFKIGLQVAEEDVRSYMKRVGLDAWYSYFEKHLPANIKSVPLVRATSAADLRRMATKSNMRLDAATTTAVLNALKKPGLGGKAVSLLDIFEPDTLATVVGGLLGKPVAAIYRGDTPTDVFFRLCVSDVGFLHKLRDQFLTGDFASQLETALQQRLAEEQTKRGSMSGRKILLDRTYFANVRSCCCCCLV
jgi:hypothetical protein